MKSCVAHRVAILAVALPAVLLLLPSVPSALAAAPAAFDWRDVDGVDYVSGVRSLQSCGIIYLFPPVAMVESRLMIEMGRQGLPVTEVDYSEQYILACGSGYYGDFNCSTGGWPDDVLAFLQETGAPREACYGYTGVDATCPTICPDTGEPLQLERPVTAHAYQTAPSDADLMDEIYLHGPVTVMFDVYEDFFSYYAGIYQHVSGSYVGGSAATIVGWGVDGATPYWIVKHSWGTGWGMDGYFWIRRDGLDGCNFGSYSFTCSVQLPYVSAASAPAAPAGLGLAYPNPFNPQTAIPYRVRQECAATLRIFDAAGRQVRTLVDGERRTPGTYEAVWNGRDDAGRRRASGVYYCRLEAGSHRETRSLVMLK